MELMKRLSQYARSAGAFVSSVEYSHPLVFGTFRRVGLSKPFKPTKAAVRAYGAVIAEKVALIDRLPPKYHQEAYELIWSHVMRGFDASGLARELSDRLGMAPDKARLIARSQCRMARAVMQNAECMEMGIREAVWHSETRCEIRSHSGMNGRRYVLAEGASLDGRRLWPGSEPSCYCSSIDIKSEDSILNRDGQRFRF
jgi:uncharacterized protein with gpF-like domain